MIDLLSEDLRIKCFHFQGVTAKLLQHILTHSAHRAGIGLATFGSACPYAHIAIPIAPGLMLEIVPACAALDFAGKAGGALFPKRLMRTPVGGGLSPVLNCPAILLGGIDPVPDVRVSIPEMEGQLTCTSHFDMIHLLGKGLTIIIIIIIIFFIH